MRKIALSLMLVFIGLFLLTGCSAKPSDKPMPTDDQTLKKFSDKITKKGDKVDRNTANQWTGTKIIKETIEDMGYSYDKTLLNFILNRNLSDNASMQPFYQAIVQQVYISPDDAKKAKLISEETYNILQATKKSINPTDLSKTIETCLSAHGAKFTYKQASDCAAKSGVIDQQNLAYISEGRAEWVDSGFYGGQAKEVIVTSDNSYAVNEKNFKEGLAAYTVVVNAKKSLGINTQ